MALLSDCNYSRSSSNYTRKTSSESSRRSNTQASAYAVNAADMALTGFHLSNSTCGAGGPVPLGGLPSPPPSPDAAPVGARPSLKARKRSGDAADHITEECERLFCETLRTVFLVEKDTGLENSLVMDVRNTAMTNSVKAFGQQSSLQQTTSTMTKHGLPTPSPSPGVRLYPQTAVAGLILDYVEVWDYAGGARFRGFVAQKGHLRAMFVFFDKEVIGMDLKPGLMSLLELASSEHFDCDQLVACVDRTADESEEVEELTKSLGWVGFELTMLDEWSTPAGGCISDRYIFLSMDV